MLIFFFKQKTAYEMRISDWSSDVCSSDLQRRSEVEVGVQFEDIGLGAIAGIAERGDFAQVARLRHAAIGIFGIEQADIIAVGIEADRIGVGEPDKGAERRQRPNVWGPDSALVVQSARLADGAKKALADPRT